MRIDGPIRVLGAMSGTSLDGVDAAVVVTDGDSIAAFGETAYRPYSPVERATIRAALGRMPGEPGVAQAAEVVENAHAELLSTFRDIDLVGFHGQTLAHRPDDRLTHQAGDGAVLAAALDLPVVWDFRSADVTLGGQGAPLASFYHFACTRRIGATEPLAFLNIGGVANLTWVDPSKSAPEAEGALLAFDTGPGNAPLDDFVMLRRGVARDEDGRMAGAGEVDRGAIDWLLERPYFYKLPPKSLDRDDFAGLAGAVAHLSDADGAATLAFAVAASVAQGLAHCRTVPARLLVTGGGRRNPTIMRMLARATGIAIAPAEDAGLDGDMLEAQAFAYLAVRVARGWPTSAPGTTGVAAPVGGGRLSRPGHAPLDFPLPLPQARSGT
jgi:anhydro-N-acetylmuramic acid kinase